MRVSINVSSFTWPDGPPGLAKRLANLARTVDAAGLDAIWVGDHLIQADPFNLGDPDMLEAYTTLGFLAAHTERAEIGTMVTAATFRPPALLIKAVTTLDVLTGGRAWLGLGAGYRDDEARAMGLPLPAGRAERFDRMEETLRLAKHMWAGDERPFEGAYYRLEAPVNRPNALRDPHPPILVGGAGERRTLPLVARYGDACNLFDIPDGGRTLRHKLDVLARCCADIGRPRAEIETTVSTRLDADESADAFAARCAALADLGVDHAVVITTGPWTDDAIARLGAARARLSA